MAKRTGEAGLVDRALCLARGVLSLQVLALVFCEGQAMHMQLGSLGRFPAGRWKAKVWIWDAGLSNFETKLMTVGWSTTLSPGPPMA